MSHPLTRLLKTWDIYFKSKTPFNTHKNKLTDDYINKVRNIFFKSLEKKLLDNGVKFYVYGLNDKKNITENDIVCKYNDIFYGMYADKWDFNKDVKCFEK